MVELTRRPTECTGHAVKGGTFGECAGCSPECAAHQVNVPGVRMLHRAVEALKPKIPVTDRKTAFWRGYKTLADEHDEEFQRKYSTDLDTALIFAGLFSAVDSAFIIQIQSEIQPHKTPLVVLIAQNLLYVSLFSTLLAALLAVLGKQWLMYYLAAGERGILETRGLERQRKFDGLRRWKFDTVMEMFPLLLQIGLFLFSTALSIYLWTVHISLAIVVLSFTSFGFVSYTALLVSAVAAPDSPFQTPLAPLVTQLIPKTLWTKLKSFSRPVLERPLRRLAEAYMPKARDLLPLSLRGQFAEKNGCAPDQPTTVFNAAFPEPSPEVPAVLWVLENSTDPHMMALAAEMVIHLQWPCTMDARQYLTRLHDGLLACFSLYHTENGPLLIRNLDGMADQAIHLGQAYCALRWVLLVRQLNPQNFRYGLPGMNRCRPELINVVCNLAGEPAIMCDSDLGLATKWALRVIPSISYRDSESKRRLLEYFLDQFNDALPTLDSHSFADYLFCIYSFLSDINPVT